MARKRVRRYAILLALLTALFLLFRRPLVHSATYAAILSDRPPLISLCFGLGEDLRQDLLGNDSGETWLMMAARQGKTEATRRLLTLGAPVDDRRYEGDTALHEAVLADHLGPARLLMEGGADVNAITGLGVTPLMYAALNGNPEMVRLLLGRGAKADARDNMNMPVRVYARKGNNREVVAQIAARLGVTVEYIHAHRGSK